MSNNIELFDGHTSSAFNKKWIANYNSVLAIGGTLCNSSFWSNLRFLFSNPSDAFVSCRVYPFNVATFTLTNVNYEAIKFYNVDSLAQGVPFAKSQYTRLLTSIAINRQFGDFRDFSPFTKLELYLPFASIVNLDVNVVTGKTLDIFLGVDFNTGGCTYYLSIRNASEPTSNGHIIMSVNGVVGFEIPLGSTNAIENQKSMLSTALSITGGIITSVITENPLPLAMASVGAVGSTFNAMQERVSKGGSSSGISAFDSPFDFYLIRTTMKQVGNGATEYARYKGRPLNEDRTLGDLRGFTICDRVHVDNIEDTTESERAELERLLQLGVIL